MMEDMSKGAVLTPIQPNVAAAKQLVAERQPTYVSYDDWLKLDALEIANGEAAGRPRLKFTCVEEMLAALGR